MLKLFINISVFLKDKYAIFNVSETLVASKAQIYYSLSGEICLLYTSMIQNISQQLPAASHNAKKQLYIVHVLYSFTTKLHFFLIMYLCLILFVNMLVFYFWLWSCINFIRHPAYIRWFNKVVKVFLRDFEWFWNIAPEFGTKNYKNMELWQLSCLKHIYMILRGTKQPTPW